MASEILSVPEESLAEVITVIRAGLHTIGKVIKPETRDALVKWCNEEEQYLLDCQEDT